MDIAAWLCELGLERYEQLTGPLSAISIPATLQESLMARLDRLPIVREVAQLGAVLGREFAYEMLRALGVITEPTLSDGLGRLVEAELLYQRGRSPKARYVFKHALVQDAAYQSLLKRTRQHYHRQVAELLESRFPEVLEAQPELLARHYTEAGSADQAVTYWQRAGEEALRRSANLEAAAHLTKGLEVLRAMPDGPERARRELDLLTTMGPALHAIKGTGAPEAEHAYRRALELCQQLGDTPRQFSALHGLWYLHHYRAEHHAARSLAEQLVEVAEVDRTTVSISRSTDRLVIAYSSSASSRRVERAWSGPSPLTIPRSMAITLFAMAVPIPAWVPCRSVHGVSGRSATPIRRLVKMPRASLSPASWHTRSARFGR